MCDAYTRLSGQNLVFDQIQIGSMKLTLTCVDGLDCYHPKPGYADEGEGYLYFVAGAKFLPLMFINDKGLQMVAPRKPKQAPAASGGAAGATNNSNQQAPTAPASQTQARGWFRDGYRSPTIRSSFRTGVVGNLYSSVS